MLLKPQAKESYMHQKIRKKLQCKFRKPIFHPSIAVLHRQSDVSSKRVRVLIHDVIGKRKICTQEVWVLRNEKDVDDRSQRTRSTQSWCHIPNVVAPVGVLKLYCLYCCCWFGIQCSIERLPDLLWGVSEIGEMVRIDQRSRALSH